MVIVVVENVFVVEVNVTTIILSFIPAPSSLQKNSMPFLYPNSMYAPFGKPKSMNLRLKIFLAAGL